MAHATTPNLGMQDFFTTTLNGAVLATDTVINLNNLPTATEGYLVIDPNTPATREVIYYNSQGSGTVICPDATAGSGRGLGGTSVQAHANGVVVEMRNVAEYWLALQNYESMANLSGVIQMFGGSAAPTGWLLCQGQAVSRSTYSALYAVIGTTYGSGDGSTTFNVPNLQSNVAAGYNASDANFNALGKTGGEATHTLTQAEMPNHTHNVGITANGINNSGSFEYVSSLFNNTYQTSATGSGGAHNNLQPYVTVNFIIKT